MPIEVAGADDHGLVRTITRNICTGGLYVELDQCKFAPGEEVRIEMTVPAGDGVSPYPARAHCRGRVARIDRIRPTSRKAQGVGVAIRFLDRLRFLM